MNIRHIAALVVLGSFAVACSSEVSKSEPSSEGTAADSKSADSSSKSSASKKPAQTFTIPQIPGFDAGAFGDDDDDNGNNGVVISNSGNGNGSSINVSGDGDSSQNVCCYNGQYYDCPNAAACTGGFDVGACQQSCGSDVSCILDCVNKLEAAGGPVGCTVGTPPPNVQCGN